MKALFPLNSTSGAAVCMMLDVAGRWNKPKQVRSLWLEAVRAGLDGDTNVRCSQIEAFLRCGQLKEATNAAFAALNADLSTQKTVGTYAGVLLDLYKERLPMTPKLISMAQQLKISSKNFRDQAPMTQDQKAGFVNLLNAAWCLPQKRFNFWAPPKGK